MGKVIYLEDFMSGKPKKPVTPHEHTEALVLNAIVDAADAGLTRAQIAKQLGFSDLSVAMVSPHLVSLVEKGFVSYGHNQAGEKVYTSSVTHILKPRSASQ